MLFYTAQKLNKELKKVSVDNVIYNNGTVTNNRHIKLHLQALQGLNNCVVPWVSQMGKEIVHGTLASEVVLDHKCEEGQHGKTACTNIPAYQLTNLFTLQYSLKNNHRIPEL